MDRVLHSVSVALVIYTQEKGRVVVWLSKRAGEKWEEHLHKYAILCTKCSELLGCKFLLQRKARNCI